MRRPAGRRCSPLESLQIDRGGAAVLLLFDVKANLLTLAQAAKSGLLHGTDVHKDILAAAFGRHKAKPLT